MAERGGIAQWANRIDLHFDRRARGRRRLADLARGNLYILLGNGILHVDGGNAEIRKFVGIEPDTHRVAALPEDLDVADTRQALQRIDNLKISVVAERYRIDRTVRRSEIDDEDEVGVLLLDRHPGLIDDRRQRPGRLCDTVLHIDGRDARRIADVERDANRR